MHDDDLTARARAWLDDDPDQADRAELEALLAANDHEEVRDRFRASLEFGTAGLRGLIGAGPNRMNLAVVLRATAGFVAYLRAKVPDVATRGIAIGFDGRRRSREFAAAAAEVVTAAGIKAMTFEDVVPTPLLGFACRDLRAAGGIMVTASHNPPLYNGYKVFWENAAQIVPPHDGGIAAEIDRVASVRTIPRLPAAEARARSLLVALGDEIAERYLAGVEALLVERPQPRALGIAYTALHGVGNRLAMRAFARAGFSNVHSVKEQAEPDGNFPTVAFPNPEEKGAMDLVLALARDTHAELVIANDPDADRLAVAARNRSGDIVVLNGNEIGCLLAHHLLEHGDRSKRRAVLNTVVSSPMLGAIAEQHGARHVQTLTGFKWIANKSLELAAEGHEVVLGYEEALGYSVKGLVRDKDGVSAAAVMAELAALLADRGKTVPEELEAMARRYGLFASKQISLVLPGEEGARGIAAMMERLRKAPPSSVGSLRVIATTDFATQTRTAGGRTEAIDLPPSDVLLYELDGGHRVMARPSGTEPKIKFYVDVRIAIAADEPLETANARGKKLCDELGDAFVAYAKG